LESFLAHLRNTIGAGNFENGNFDTNLISQIGWWVSSKIIGGNFEFSIEKNGNFENVVMNYVTYEHITGPRNQVPNILAKFDWLLT